MEDENNAEDPSGDHCSDGVPALNGVTADDTDGDENGSGDEGCDEDLELALALSLSLVENTPSPRSIGFGLQSSICVGSSSESSASSSDACDVEQLSVVTSRRRPATDSRRGRGSTRRNRSPAGRASNGSSSTRAPSGEVSERRKRLCRGTPAAAAGTRSCVARRSKVLGEEGAPGESPKRAEDSPPLSPREDDVNVHAGETGLLRKLKRDRIRDRIRSEGVGEAGPAGGVQARHTAVPKRRTSSRRLPKQQPMEQNIELGGGDDQCAPGVVAQQWMASGDAEVVGIPVPPRDGSVEPSCKRRCPVMPPTPTGTEPGGDFEGSRQDGIPIRVAEAEGDSGDDDGDKYDLDLAVALSLSSTKDSGPEQCDSHTAGGKQGNPGTKSSRAATKPSAPQSAQSTSNVMKLPVARPLAVESEVLWRRLHQPGSVLPHGGATRRGCANLSFSSRIGQFLRSPQRLEKLCQRPRPRLSRLQVDALRLARRFLFDLLSGATGDIDLAWSKKISESNYECHEGALGNTKIAGDAAAQLEDPPLEQAVSRERLETVVRSLGLPFAAHELDAMMRLWSAKCQRAQCARHSNDSTDPPERLCAPCFESAFTEWELASARSDGPRRRPLSTPRARQPRVLPLYDGNSVSGEPLAVTWSQFCDIFDDCELRTERSGRVW